MSRMQPHVTCMRYSRSNAIILTVVTLAAATPARAQYDRDGRYVPSPNGIPSDPTARPIPMYSGTPGSAIGTPIMPRADMIPPAAPPQPTPRLSDEPRPTVLKRYRPPNTKQVPCDQNCLPRPAP